MTYMQSDCTLQSCIATYNPFVPPAIAADSVLGRVNRCVTEQVNGQGAAQA